MALIVPLGVSGWLGMIRAQSLAEFHSQKGKTPQGEALMSLSGDRAGTENPCKGEEAGWEWSAHFQVTSRWAPAGSFQPFQDSHLSALPDAHARPTLHRAWAPASPASLCGPRTHQVRPISASHLGVNCFTQPIRSAPWLPDAQTSPGGLSGRSQTRF